MADGSVIIDTKLDDSGLKNGLGKLQGGLKSGLATMGKAAVAGIAAATTAVGALTAAAVNSYGEYEQLVGGMETLFKDSSDKMLSYADQAYKTAQISANDYMSLATSFSASLLQGLGGDTEQAAEKANSAIIDMADNANKMGTSMESIQYAYQGFAKQNYTMLDNLKLGYGGTQAEMARLINDSGVLGDTITVTAETVNSVSFDKIIDAIHVVQTNLGITGTSAQEASSTIQGSINMTKAAWENFVTGLGDSNADMEKLTQNLAESAGLALQNLIPVVENVLMSLPALFDQIVPIIGEKLPELIAQLTPKLVEGALALLNGLLANLPVLIQPMVDILTTLVSYLTENISSIVDVAFTLVETLVNALIEAAPTLIPEAVNAIMTLLLELTNPDKLNSLVETAITLIQTLADSIIDAIPILIDALPELIDNLVSFIVNNTPKMIECGIELIVKLAVGLIKAIPQLIAKLPQIITSLFNGLIEGVYQMALVGKRLIEGLWEGIKDAGAWLWDKISGFFGGIVDGIKDFFGIHSPSKLFEDAIGKNLMLGLANGIDDEAESAVKSMTNAAKSISNVKFKADTNSLFQNINPGETISRLSSAINDTGTGLSRRASIRSGISTESSSDVEGKIGTVDGKRIMEGDVYLDKQKVGRILAPEIAKEIDWSGK